MKRSVLALAAAAALCLCLGGCTEAYDSPSAFPFTQGEPSLPPLAAVELTPSPEPSETADPKGNEEALDENGSYDSVDDVARYLQTYGELPENYITKDEAEDLGWNGGSVERYAPGMCIGGDRFGNREGLLPEEKGRTWTECDIDTLGEDSRGAKRLVFSNDGLIYYTDDHYESFERIYPEE